MRNTTRINLHLHSNVSDGELTPEALAEKLAMSGVAYAALTDHDTVDGLQRFHEALRRCGIGFVSGVEMTAQWYDREIHLLAYGFDPGHRKLKTTLLFLRRARLARVQGPLRQLPSQALPELEGEPASGVAETGKIQAEEAVRLVHDAGGLVFWAHPLTFASGLDRLERHVAELKALGLDGIETVCGYPSASERKLLDGLAGRHDLLVCAGTDFHHPEGNRINPLGIDIPTENWKQLVGAMAVVSGSLNENDPAPEPVNDGEEDQPWSSFRPRIVVPSVLAILLFITTIWGMILPSIENLLIDRKRDTIRELAHTTLSLMAAAEEDVRAGRRTPAEAREKAKSDIGALRYGKEGKDYFWIQDMYPRMIMHPYRSDLNGKDVSGVTDPRGVHIFIQFADVVRRQKHGFVEYVWQWKDDPDRLAAKESYVRGFAPWGWIIGTGIYLDDVRQEVKRIERNVVYSLVAIVGLVFFVLLYNVRQSLRAERKQREMRASLREAEARYRALIEATTEGILLVVGGRCRYGNPTLLNMVGYGDDRLELLELTDLLPRETPNMDVWAGIDEFPDSASGVRSYAAELVCADGEKRACVITLNPVVFADQPAIIVLVKEMLPLWARASGGAMRGGPDLRAPTMRLVRGGDILALDTAARRVAVSNKVHDLAPALTDDDGSEWNGSLLRTIAVLQLPSRRPVALLREIAAADVADKVVRACHDGPALIGELMDDGLQPRLAAHLISAICDAATIRFIELAIADLGDPPVPFAFIAMGSQGRQEQTLLTDQDNAIIYEAFDGNVSGGQTPAGTKEAADPDPVAAYFLSLGKKVCRWMDLAGFTRCAGDVMASNPRWCRSLTAWKTNFVRWIQKAESKDLLDAAICLDFRLVYGKAELVRELRERIYAVLEEHPRFLSHLAQAALHFKPPLRILGKIIKSGGPAEAAGRLDMKEIGMPIVGFGRLYALSQRLSYTHTMDRIEALVWQGSLDATVGEAVGAAYDFLMALRFKTQLAHLQNGRKVDNAIDMAELDHQDEAMLKQAFLRIESLQKKIVHDFLGGVVWPGG